MKERDRANISLSSLFYEFLRLVSHHYSSACWAGRVIHLSLLGVRDKNKNKQKMVQNLET